MFKKIEQKEQERINVGNAALIPMTRTGSVFCNDWGMYRLFVILKEFCKYLVDAKPERNTNQFPGSIANTREYFITLFEYSRLEASKDDFVDEFVESNEILIAYITKHDELTGNIARCLCQYLSNLLNYVCTICIVDHSTLLYDSELVIQKIVDVCNVFEYYTYNCIIHSNKNGVSLKKIDDNINNSRMIMNCYYWQSFVNILTVRLN